MTDETNMQPESQPSVANSTPQQDKSGSCLSEQTAEYPRKNHTTKGESIVLSRNDRQSENEVEDPRPAETAATNMQSGSYTGAVVDTPPLGRTPVLPHGPDCRIPHKGPRDQRAMHPNRLSSDTQEEKENAICSNGLPGHHPGRSH